MRALSIRNPWPYAILHLDKRFENRSWPTCQYRGPIALHASKTKRRRYTVEIIEEWHDEGLMGLGEAVLHPDEVDWPGTATELFEALPHGAIVGVADVVDWVSGIGDVMRRHAAHDRRWYTGGGALVLDNVRALPEPIPCTGALGLWFPSNELRAQIEKAAA